METKIRWDGVVMTVQEATTEQLEAFARYKRKQIREGKCNPQYLEQDKRQVLDARKEVERRKKQGAGDPQPTQQVQPFQPKTLGISISNVDVVNSLLAEANSKCHLIGGVTHIDMIPEGFGVSLTLLQVAIGKETYPVGMGKLGISATALARIGNALAIEWDSERSRRTDDGRDPHVCPFLAVGWIRNFDGTQRQISGHAEVDMREGSAQVEEIRVRAAQKAKEEGKSNDGGEAEIRQIRKFILRHAETKARNRAIASLGIARSYTQEDLRKPFAVARMVFTGQSDDPEFRRELARENARAAIYGRSALYGAPRKPEPPPIEAPADDEPPPDSGFNWDVEQEEEQANGKF